VKTLVQYSGAFLVNKRGTATEFIFILTTEKGFSSRVIFFTQNLSNFVNVKISDEIDFPKAVYCP